MSEAMTHDVSGKTSLSYQAVESSTKRRNPVTKSTHEVFYLDRRKRETASATARDDRRNFTILAWMIRRHCDNVARFTPHIRTRNDNLDRIVKRLLAWHSRPRNFDMLGRHGRDEFMRMFEACKVISGDAAALKGKGFKLQGIEGDRISKPSSFDGATLSADEQKSIPDDGIIFNGDGTRNKFCICKRSGTRGDSLTFERFVPASDVIYDGYWPERFDSNRGVSPLITALNEGADIRDSRESLIQKIKASGIFGLAFERQGVDPPLPQINQSDTDTAAEAPTTVAASYSEQLKDAIQTRGIINLDMDPGDKVSEIESSTPYPPAVEFTRQLIRDVMLALDLPFTFYDSLGATFSSRVADRNEYEEACEWKREKNIGVLDEIYGGWLFKAWADADHFGLGNALKEAGISVEELGAMLKWVPAGRPWLDKAGEMSGHILALAAGATSIPRICASYGEDAYELAEEQKEFLEKSGIPLLYAQGGQVPVNELMKNAMKGSDNNGNDSPQQ